MNTNESNELMRMVRRWRRRCGRPGGACVQGDTANQWADKRVKDCAKELEEFVTKGKDGEG